MRAASVLIATVLSTLACSQAPVVPPAAEKAQAAAAALALPFIENDYGRALAEARAKALPLFIEAWAPW
jgi:hypothetical protein